MPGCPAHPRHCGDIVELRVHGVSGARARAVLDRPHVDQVAGDRSGGFYRPREGYPDSRGPCGTQPEMYRWSDLPSGTASRTLSLVFLLPFMLSNVAIWMRPRTPGDGAVVKALCRLLAFTLTVLYVLSVVAVALDLLAWKCMASSQCLAGRDWLSWLGGRPVGVRLGIMSLVPLAAIGLLWWLSARPGRAFEAFEPERAETTPGDRLDSPGCWRSNVTDRRLRAIHVTGGLSTVDAVLLVAAQSGRAPGIVSTLGTVTAVMFCCCVGLLCVPTLDRRAAWVDALTRALPTVAVILTVATIAAVVAVGSSWADTPGLPGYEAVVVWVFAAQTLLLAVLGLVVLPRRVADRSRPALLHGLGSPVIAAVGVGLAVAFSAELVYQTSHALGAKPSSGAEALLSPPPLAYKWAIFAFIIAVAGATTVGGVATLASRRQRYRVAASIVSDDHPDPVPSSVRRRRRVRQAIAKARFTERLGPLAVVYACLTATGLAATVLGLVDLQPVNLAQRVLGSPSDLVAGAITVGSYAVLAILIALVVGGLFAYRTAEFRRFVGVLWDLGTFWPRVAHPFAPTCYAERAVPELARRLTFLTGRGDLVVAAGHSHGSVLLTAAVLQLRPEARARVALLTHGSPLRRLYAELFPAYLGDDVLHQVGDQLGWRWINLWRDTDPIGGGVFSGHRSAETAPAGGLGRVDRRLTDPIGLAVPPNDSTAPPIQGHWPCENDPRYIRALCHLVEQLRRASPPSRPGCSHRRSD